MSPPVIYAIPSFLLVRLPPLRGYFPSFFAVWTKAAGIVCGGVMREREGESGSERRGWGGGGGGGQGRQKVIILHRRL